MPELQWLSGEDHLTGNQRTRFKSRLDLSLEVEVVRRVFPQCTEGIPWGNTYIVVFILALLSLLVVEVRKQRFTAHLSVLSE